MAEAFFKAEVLDQSEELPVLVDFWAPWCGPCRVLGPLLETLESEAQGAWRLVKIDTDDNPSLAQRLRIQSLPTVMLFHKGEVLGEFKGALPRPQLEKWLEEHLPNPSREALSGAREARNQGKLDEALRLVEVALAESPGSPEARVARAELELIGSPEAAVERVDGIRDTEPVFPRVEALTTLADLHTRRDEIRDAAQSSESKAWSLYHDGLESFWAGESERTLEVWIEALGRKSDLDNGTLKNACKALFVWLGDEHPLSHEYRRAFASALF